MSSRQASGQLDIRRSNGSSTPRSVGLIPIIALALPIITILRTPIMVCSW